MSQDWSKGSTRKWRKIRLLVLRRDRGICQLRLDVCTHKADCVHHVKGKKFGDDPRWLVASCTPCNLAVGDPNRPSAPGKPASDPEPRPTTLFS